MFGGHRDIQIIHCDARDSQGGNKISRGELESYWFLQTMPGNTLRYCMRSVVHLNFGGLRSRPSPLPEITPLTMASQERHTHRRRYWGSGFCNSPWDWHDYWSSGGRRDDIVCVQSRTIVRQQLPTKRIRNKMQNYNLYRQSLHGPTLPGI